jgi:monofunctional biosynthetic peptidoglycan transglycosylase
MAKRAGSGGRKTKGRGAGKAPVRPLRLAGFVLLRTTTILILGVFALVCLFALVNPPTTHTIWSEGRRLGGVEHRWVPLEQVAPVMARAVVAAEDANFCLHWGFDVEAIRSAIAAGAARGASTVSQQVVKNVFLWQHRSWLRKAMETAITPAVEAVWTKRRILEAFTAKSLYPYTHFYLRDVHKRFGAYWHNHFSTIGLVGMNEASETLVDRLAIHDKPGAADKLTAH